MNRDPLAPKKNVKEPNKSSEKLLPITISLIVIIPSAIIGLLLKDHTVPVHYSHMVGITVLLLAVFNFTTVVMIEGYNDVIKKFTIPAIVASTAIIFMFIIAESLNRFLTEMGYSYITPFLFIVILFTYFAVFKEKHFILKTYLSLNTLALYILWAMGSAETFTTPF